MQITYLIETPARARVGENIAGFTSSDKKLLFLLEALVLCNLEYLRDNPDTPGLYQSGVIYQAESPGQERWKDIPHILEDGYGDCEDLAGYRCAELRRNGVRAKITLKKKWYQVPGIMLYHILVRHPNGRLEDPSALLGMEGEFQ